MTKLNFEQFQEQMTFEGGQSRYGTYGVSYILLKDEENEEIFYAEYNGEENEALEEQFIKNAYAAYLDGDDVYTE